MLVILMTFVVVDGRGVSVFNTWTTMR